jgi:hypothetical protein
MNSQESKKYSVKDLEKLNVTGVGGLRDLVVKNKIFKGIANLKKKQIIEDILSSDWWKKNGINDEVKEEKEGKEEKEEKEGKTEQPTTLKECLTQKQKLRNEIRELERRIKDRDKILKQKQDEEKKQEEEIRENREKRKQRKKENREKKKVESILNTKETQTDEIKENNIEIKKELEEIEEIEEKINKDAKEVKEIETQTEETQTEEIKTLPLSHSPHTEGLISHKEEQKKNVDVGHTIVNVYCGGHQSPNYPVPQYVVRQALNSNNLPLHQQQEIGDMMKQEAPQFTQAPPQFTQAPPQAPPQAPQFTQAPTQAPPTAPPAPKSQVRKFPPVQTIKPVRISDIKPKDKDDDESEDEIEKEERLEREEDQRIQKLKEERLAEARSGKQRGFNPKFMERLAQKLSAGM